MTFRRVLSAWTLRVCAIVNAVPLLLTRHLPFCDLPEHTAVVATLYTWNDPVLRARDQFTIAHLWQTPYFLFHVVAAAVAFALGSAERAVLFLLILTAIAYPYALRELLVALRRDERLAVVGIAAFWSRATAEGLVNYVASVPVAIYTLALAVRHLETPTRRREWGLVALAIATFFLHVSSFAMLACGACAIAMLAPCEPQIAFGERIKRLRWLALPSLVAAAMLSVGVVLRADPSFGLHAGRVRFAPIRFRVRELWGWMHDFWRSPGDDIAGAILWLALAIVVFDRSVTPRESQDRRVGLVLVGLAAAFYFFGPSQVSFAFLLDLRMATFLMLFVPLLTTPRSARRADVAAALAASAMLLLGVHGIVQMRVYDRLESGYFDVLLRRLEPRKRLVSLVFLSRSERVLVSPFVHFGAYYRIRYGGIASFSFAELPHWPVQYRPEIAPPRKSITFWDWAPCLYRNTVDGVYYDYVLARGETDPFGHAPGPRWRIIGALRDWRLYERAPGVVPGDPAADHGPCAQ